MTTCNTVTIVERDIERAKNFVVPKAQKPEKIVVALSGGVDSSVAAWLLKEAGHEVIGVSLRLAPDDTGSLQVRQGRCCSVNDMTDARQICDKLDIPFYAIDARDRFKETVFDPFVKAYREGHTPIPCLACNHVVKFGDLHKTARSLGAKLATGHYARVVEYEGAKALARPLDQSRDQTYYLYGTSPEVIDTLELPLGDLDKPFIRALAREMGISVATKPDSQEICFVPDGDHSKVVERASGPLPKGDLVLLGGKKVGQHDGVHKFTIGQRRGIGVGFGERKYVIDINPKNSNVVLGPRSALECSAIAAGSIKCAIAIEKWPKEIGVQIRARQPAQPATWEKVGENEIRFALKTPTVAVTLGHAAVAYDGDVLLGGGIITGRLDGAVPRSS